MCRLCGKESLTARAEGDAEAALERFGDELPVGVGEGFLIDVQATRLDQVAPVLALGRGEPPPSGKLAEGASTAPVLVELAASRKIEMPVSSAVAAILAKKLTIDAAIDGLLTRPFRAEG